MSEPAFDSLGRSAYGGPDLQDYEDTPYEVCSLCRGTGNIGSHLCPDCAGRCIVLHECVPVAQHDNTRSE